jgi:hypothetical protein
VWCRVSLHRDAAAIPRINSWDSPAALSCTFCMARACGITASDSPVVCPSPLRERLEGCNPFHHLASKLLENADPKSAWRPRACPAEAENAQIASRPIANRRRESIARVSIPEFPALEGQADICFAEADAPSAKFTSAFGVSYES